jgi:hypothetical protein
VAVGHPLRSKGAGIGVRLRVRRFGPRRLPARQMRAPQPTSEHSSPCASGSPREVEPPVHYLGVRPDPFWDNRSIFSGLSAGDYSSPAPILLNSAYRGSCEWARAQNRYLSQGQSSASGGVLGLTARIAGLLSRSRARIGLIPWLTTGSETTEAGVTRSWEPQRIGRLRPSISTPFAQQPGTPEPPGTPPQPPPDPMAPPPYEDPPRPLPIPRPG